MKRRTFIRYTATALGVAAIPLKGSGQCIGRFTELMRIPGEVNHIRHGTFAMKAYNNPMLPAWLRLYESHRLHANGFEPGPDDLHTFSFTIRNNTYTLAYNKDMCSLIAPEIPTALHEQSGAIKFPDGMVLRGEFHDESMHSGFLAVMSGQVIAGDAIIDEGEFLVSESPIYLRQSGDESLSILLHQTES